MKKTILSLTIATMGLWALTACTGNSDNNAQGSDTTATELTEEPKAEQPQAEIPIKDLTELECDQYLITIPQGCKASSRVVNSSCNMTFSGQPYTTAAASVQMKTLDEYKAACEKEGFKAIDDITVDGHTYIVMFKEDAEQGRHAVKAATPRDGGELVCFNIFNGAHKMEPAEAKDVLMKHVQAMLQATKLK